MHGRDDEDGLIPTEELEDQPEPEAKSPPPPVRGGVPLGGTLPEHTRKKISEALRNSRKDPMPLPGKSAAEAGLDLSGYITPPKDLAKVKVTDELKARFLERLLIHGKRAVAAAECGVVYRTLKNHMKADPTFKDQVDDVLLARAEMIVDQIEEEALAGHVEMVYDKDTGELVMERTKYETPIRLAMLKRYDEGYTERTTTDVNVRGGVLVVPGRLDPESWERLFAPPDDPNQVDDGEDQK